MPGSKLIRRFRRPIRDFTLALGAFSVVTVLSVCDTAQQTGLFGGHAHAYRFAGEGASATGFVTAIGSQSQSAGGLDQFTVLMSLALAFAGMLTLNLWFARHVRRVRAVERRRSSR